MSESLQNPSTVHLGDPSIAIPIHCDYRLRTQDQSNYNVCEVHFKFSWSRVPALWSGNNRAEIRA